jgi:hypothetical protein
MPTEITEASEAEMAAASMVDGVFNLTDADHPGKRALDERKARRPLGA